jgi:hypothetical protein
MDGWMDGFDGWQVFTPHGCFAHLSPDAAQHSSSHQTSTHPHHSTPPWALAAGSVTFFFLKRQRPSHVACSGWVLGAGLSAAMILSKLTGAESLAGAGSLADASPGHGGAIGRRRRAAVGS